MAKAVADSISDRKVASSILATCTFSVQFVLKFSYIIEE